MNRNFITVTIEQIPEEGECRISVCGERNGRRCFSESFESKSEPIGVHLVSKKELGNIDYSQSFSVTCLLKLLEDIIQSKKTHGGMYDENTENIKFSFIELKAIKQFERIAGIEFDYSKFQTLREFQNYFSRLVKGAKEKED